jgi:uncharacterized membrane protein HdeD (DUF308 family)
MLDFGRIEHGLLVQLLLDCTDEAGVPRSDRRDPVQMAKRSSETPITIFRSSYRDLHQRVREYTSQATCQHVRLHEKERPGKNDTMSKDIAINNTANSEVASKWRWFIALGIVLIVLGAAAWLDVVSVTLATTTVIGASMLVGGVFQIIHAFITWESRRFVFALISGLLYFAGGLVIMSEPVHGAAVLTLVLMALLIAGGIVRVVLSMQYRGIRAWGLVFVSGIVGVVVGFLLYAKMPWSGLWILGTLIAIELLVQGGGWLYFGVALQRFHRAPAR